MNQLPLAEIERVYAVQHKEFLMIIAEGYVSGSGGSLHIWKSRTKIFPALFEIYEMPGTPASDPQTAQTKIPAVAANLFHGMHSRIQILFANNRIFPKIIEAAEEEYGLAEAVISGTGATQSESVPEQWTAIHEYAPQGPPKIRVAGIATIPNLGVSPILVRSKSQGLDPKVLLLDIVTEALTNVQGDLRWSKPTQSCVKYEEETDFAFESVQIESIQKSIDVQNVRWSPSKAKTGEAGA
jgi:hypothetical protein